MTGFRNYGDLLETYPIQGPAACGVRRELAAEHAGWGKLAAANASGLGIAAHRSFQFHVATVADVAVDDKG